MISTELDLAKKLFGFAGMGTAVSGDAATSVRIGTVTQINADGSISVRLSDTGETVYLRASTPVKVGDTVSIIKQGGVYVVYALDALSEQISKQEQELIDFAGALGDLGTQIDGKVETHFYAYTPTTSNIPASQWGADEKQAHAGDLFYNTSNGYVYRWTGSAWQQITDSRIQDALNAASRAEDTADSKRRVFTSQPTGPYDRGDLWVNVSNPGELKVCKTAESGVGAFYASDWVVATSYTDDTTVNELIKSFSMTQERAYVSITKGNSTEPTTGTAYWWSFKPSRAKNAPTVAYCSIPLANVATPKYFGGMGEWTLSDWSWTVRWPSTFDNITYGNLPIVMLGASGFGEWCFSTSYNRDTDGIGPIVVTRPYKVGGTIPSVRIEIMAVERRL